MSSDVQTDIKKYVQADIQTQKSRSAHGQGSGFSDQIVFDRSSFTNGEREIQMTVNERLIRVKIKPWVTLLDCLRENLNFHGTKKGCDNGQCGACTVLVDGARINSCLQLAVMTEGQSVTTVEGVATEAGLAPIQSAFIEHDAFQCGYCTPGQICSAVGLMNEIKSGANKPPTREEIREAMSGNLCRCGAYANITAAVEEVIASAIPQRSGSHHQAPKASQAGGAV